MGNPTMWFEVAGKDREALNGFYSRLFDWQLKDMEGESKEIDELAERLDDLQDHILRQPAELGSLLKRMVGPGRDGVDRAASILRESRDLYVVGIGASWNAGLAILPFFSRAGRPALLADASELMQPLSRGRSAPESR